MLTLTTYLLAGTMREQVCTYLCPWPRIQGALTDEYALNVTYRYDRGEPRGPLRKNETWDGRGDCIDCKQCVQVCPMGIDIRDGAQLECIHCALCIDACDEMMRRVDRPTGLIAYDTDRAVQARLDGRTEKYKLLRPRTLLYGVLIGCISTLVVWSYFTRSSFEFSVLKDRSPSYVRVENGVRNGYTLKLVNKVAKARSFEISIAGPPSLQARVIGISDPETANTFTVPSGAHGLDRYRLLVTVPETARAAQTKLRITVRDVDGADAQTSMAPFIFPED